MNWYMYIVIVFCVIQAFCSNAASRPYPYAVKNALHAGNLLLAKKLISENPRLVSEGVEFGHSHLHVSIVQHADLSFIQWLIKKGAPMESPACVHPSKRINLLKSATVADYRACIPLLISHGVNVDQRDKTGKTPLMIAALFDHTYALKALLAHGASIDAQDDRGMTALHWALTPQCRVTCDWQKYDITTYVALKAAFVLLMHGPNGDLKNDRGIVAIDCPMYEAAEAARRRYLADQIEVRLSELANSEELAVLRVIQRCITEQIRERCPICARKAVLTFWGLCTHQLCKKCKHSWMHSGRSNGILCPFCRQVGIKAEL